MCSLLRRFLSKITRTRNRNEDEDAKLDLLNDSGRVSVLKSVELLLGACFNAGIFIVVGIAVKCIAGPAMVLSVILGAIFTTLNILSLCELCSRFPSKVSYYDIIYDTVGELCAFIFAWFQLIQAIFMVSVVSVATGEYIHYLANPSSDISWLPPHKLFAEIEQDTLVFTVLFLVVLSFILSVGIPYGYGFLKTLFWINATTFLCMLLIILYYAGSLHWEIPLDFQPYHYTGTIKGIAITTFFFTHLDRIIEQTQEFKKTDYVLPVSLGVSLLCAFVYYLCATIFLANLIPIADILKEVSIPKAFVSATFYDSKYILSTVALIIFCLTITESYFSAQRAFNLLVEDGLIYHRFSNSKSKKKTAILAVLSVALLSMPLFIWLSVTSLIEGFCISSLILTILINCTAVIVQYQPAKGIDEKETSIFPNWECAKSTIIRFILCFGYITHKKVLSTCGVKQDIEPNHQTSKIINWCVLTHVPSCLGLALAMMYGLPGLGENGWIILAAVLLLLVTIFLNLRMILMQPRGKMFFFENSIVASLIPLVNVGLTCILLVTLDWKAFIAIGVWTSVGLVAYFAFGISHGNEAVFNRLQQLNEKSPGRVRYESSPQLLTSIRNIQPENTDADSQHFLFSDDTELLDFPQSR